MQFAYRFVAEEGGLSQRVMRELVDRPRPFVDLKSLNHGRDPSELTDALTRLEGDGLIQKRTSQRQVPIVHTYELTALGALAEGAMQRLRPVQEVVRTPRRRQKSDLRL